jgi:hypothetical protein
MSASLPGLISTDRNVCANQVTCNVLNYGTLNPPVGGGATPPLDEVLAAGNSTGGISIDGALARLVLDTQPVKTSIGLMGQTNVSGSSETIVVQCGGAGGSGSGGSLILQAGSASSFSTLNSGGSVQITSGQAPIPGDIVLTAGNCQVGGVGTGGKILNFCGDGTAAGDTNGGDYLIRAGRAYGTGGVCGNIVLMPGINLQQASSAYQMGNVGIQVTDARYSGMGGAHFCAEQDSAPGNVSAGGSDMAGMIANIAGGASVVVTFIRAYTVAPIVVVSATEPFSGGDLIAPLYTSNVTSAGFTVTNPNVGTTTNAYYIVIGTQL